MKVWFVHEYRCPQRQIIMRGVFDLWVWIGVSLIYECEHQVDVLSEQKTNYLDFLGDCAD